MALVPLALASIGLILVFLVASVGQVDQNQYGLVFNWVTKKINPTVHHGGTHLIFPWNKFVTFPATVQTIEFSDRIGKNTAGSLHTRTKEGLGLQLSISFQYKLNPDDLPKLYQLTNVAYEALYMRLARDQLLEAASQYEGPSYWSEREKIGHHMRRLVDSSLRSSFGSLWGLQLLLINLPDQFENSITKTQVQQQLMKTKQQEQLATAIRADTEVLQADFEKRILVVQAGAEANYSLATKLAEAEATKRSIEAEAGVLDYVRDKLHLSALGTVEYQQLGSYASLQNATFLANVFGATPVIAAGSAAGTTGSITSLLKQNAQKTQSSEEVESRLASTSSDSASEQGKDLSVALDELSSSLDGMQLLQEEARPSATGFLSNRP